MICEPGEYGILTFCEIKEGRFENYEREICFRRKKKKSVVKEYNFEIPWTFVTINALVNMFTTEMPMQLFLVMHWGLQSVNQCMLVILQLSFTAYLEVKETNRGM